MTSQAPRRWRKEKCGNTWRLVSGSGLARLRLTLGTVAEHEATRALATMQDAEDAGPFATVTADQLIALHRYDRGRANALLLGHVAPERVPAAELKAPESPAAEPPRPKARRKRRVRLSRKSEGWIYFVGAEEGPIKIGFTTGAVSKRVGELQIGRPDCIREYGAIPGTLSDEQSLHRALESFRVRGEWFERGPALGALAALQAFAEGEAA